MAKIFRDLDIFLLPGAPPFEIEISSKPGVFGLHLCRWRVGFGRKKKKKKAGKKVPRVFHRG